MRKLPLLFIVINIFYTASSQIMAGASIGTFNMPGAGTKFKGIGPTIKLEYGKSDRSSVYLDGSLYNKKQNSPSTTITDGAGAYIGEADTKAHYSIRHLQLGFKNIFGKDLSDKGFSFFVGGGIAISLVKTTYKYTLTGYDIPDSKYNNTLFGFHFNAGVQYNLDPIIIEFKGNFDLMLKPVVTGDSYAILASRLGVLIPLEKQ